MLATELERIATVICENSVGTMYSKTRRDYRLGSLSSLSDDALLAVLSGSISTEDDEMSDLIVYVDRERISSNN
jgi:hypothetical protein